MKIRVLGCGGSIGIPEEGTTSFLIDDDILLDAGTGVCSMRMSDLEKIQHVFLTHTHLDHICALPFLVDTVGVNRVHPLTVYASAASISALKAYIFNEAIWPDFTRIPSPERAVMRYQEIHSEQAVEVGRRRFLPIDVNHSVPAFGFLVDDGGSAWAFSGDTHRTDRFYELINATPEVSRLFIESAFPDHEDWIADLSYHLCPGFLFDELKKLRSSCEVWISHLKPREADTICTQLKDPALATRQVHLLQAGMEFHFL
jgi:ribonuclease BN (tRNA processing enzyme)